VVDFQRSFARRDGRVQCWMAVISAWLLDADVKLFVTASPESQGAERQFNELTAKGWTSFKTVLADVKQRDARDQEAGRAAVWLLMPC
jgi:cytidylate kinase